MKRIAILGSTGSIGTQTLDVVRNNNGDADSCCDGADKNREIEVVALAAGHNIKALAEQIVEFSPKLVCIADEKDYSELKELTPNCKYDICFGMDGLIQIAECCEYDILVTAIVGMMGIRPTIRAIETGHDIALANKETLVTAGHIIIDLAQKHNVSILPVDSEHSAIFQCLNGENSGQVEKIILTASGGPFRGRTLEELRNVRVSDALKHPNWSMGKKITIDSATMINKGLEVMEAKWLFGVEYEQVQVVVQPQSIIHSMIQFVDGGVMAQLGSPDMRLPIQYALYYPERRPLNSERLDFAKLSHISFENPDTITFRGLALAYEVGKKGGNLPTIYNAANEIAVSRFLDEKIGFTDITDMIERALDSIEYIDNPTLEDILETERRVAEFLR